METSQKQEEVPTTESTPTQDPIAAKDQGKKKEKGKDSKAEREALKAARLAERIAKAEEAKKKEFTKDPLSHKFGDLELNRSQSDPELRYAKKFTQVHELDDSFIGQEVIIRGRLHRSKKTGANLVFIILRERFATVQAILQVKEGEVSPGMIKYTASIPKESIIEIKANVVAPAQPIEGCSQKIELNVTEIWTVNKSAPILPFQIDDAGRRVEN